MSRLRIEPAPERDALGELPVHVVIRDFPETLSVFRNHGVDLAATGGDAVAQALADPESLIDALAAAVAWRT